MLTLAEAAQRSGPLPAGIRAEATLQEALGLAMLGEPLPAVEKKLDVAYAILARDSEQDPGTPGGYFDQDVPLTRSAACYTEAGKPVRAAEILGDVLAADTLSSRDTGYFQARRAAALALVGEPDEAADQGLEAARVARATHSRRTTDVLADMLETLGRWSTRPSGRALREFLADPASARDRSAAGRPPSR